MENVATTSFFTSTVKNSLSILIKTKFVGRSCKMEDLKHVFINFNFENDLLQLAIETPMVSSNHALHNVGKTSVGIRTKHSSACLELKKTALPLAGRSIQKLITLS